ncbi:hypothetical protein DSM03_10475 [Leeuwenhoekiella aestuarii]|uniref:Uncharacterized protein n=1 Tax=Leeuwenhoekiella aestuarii TaxID=2249426 RepID=A0A4V1KP30_9FLAO|nr:hypothetical protein [Leeuwenhoekiella aestuarii]RXG13351.1 hypothetical protein DSM04_105330 [Leeuwenhoekiella aestuarii]RXG14918.1 hypothetical protein DSM03_10475 [Leeuwenhoekiella aestuarii]
MEKLFSLFIVLTLLTSCSKEDSIQIDLSKFDAITEPFPYKNIHTEIAYDYYELLYATEGSVEERIVSEGNLCAGSTKPDMCIETYNSLETMFGFAGGCLPSYCFLYIKLQEGDTNSILNTPEQLLSFLETIDTHSEAILWANANGYKHSSTTKEIGAIKEVGDHFELLVSELVSGCLPVQTDQVHLRIDSDGKITELERAVYTYDKKSCI